jgi:hypothetical protein
MGYLSKGDYEGDTLSGGSGSWVKRSVKKVFYAVLVVLSFGIYSSGISSKIIDIGLRTNAPMSEVLQVSFIKALQYGTLTAPEMVLEGSKQVFTYPITAIFTNFIPFLFIYGAWFQITSIIVDILDGRRTDSVGFLGKALATIGLMLGIYAIYTGVVFFEPTAISFNATEVAVNQGWINESVSQSAGGVP